MPQVKTACPRNCYSTCSMNVNLKNGKIGLIEPDQKNQATPEGICLKGLSYTERVYSADRILHPMLKNKESGKFEKIGWPKAINLIAGQLQRLKEEFGPKSVLYYSASGTKGLLNGVGMDFWRLYGGCSTTYGDLCWPAGLEATRLMLGENSHNAPWDIENAKLIVLWGKNAAETNIHQMVFIDRALEHGAKLVVIDPRRTQSAERAALLLQPRPGTDGALALGVANYLIEHEQYDKAFVKRNVLGFDPFAEMVKRYTPEAVGEICEISKDSFLGFAKMVAEIHPMTICAGFGMQRYSNSGQTMRAMIALTALTGNLGKSGAGWQFANLQSQVFSKVKDPIDFYPPEKDADMVRVSISTSKLGEGILNAQDPPIKMIWVERGNPVTQNPDTNTVLKAFRSVDFRVVVEQFLTDTAREADLILPAKTMFEQSDIINAYWHDYLQLKRKVIDPPGEVKPESEIYYLLAKKLGFSEAEMKGKIPRPGDASIDAFLEAKLKIHTNYTLADFDAGPLLSPGHQDVAFADLKFRTPSGRIEFYSEEAIIRWGSHPLPVFFEIAQGKKGEDYNKKYPLYFMTPNTKNRIHSQFNNLKLIRQFSEKPLLHIHPQDAQKRGISEGDRVKIFNKRGNLSLPATLDFALKPGCISVTNGWWISEGGTVNFCSNGVETDMGYGAAFHDNLVEVKLHGQ